MKEIVLKASEYSKIFWLEAMKLPPQEQARYHLYGIYHYDSMDEYRLKQALQVTVNTNYNLRSNFYYNNGVTKQVIHENIEANLMINSAETEEEYQEILIANINKPFDLANDPLFRFLLIKNQHTSTFILLLNFHHIILDGTQYDKLIGQIEENYHNPKQLNATDKVDINCLKEYLKWEKEQILKVNVSSELKKLKTFPLTVDLPVQRKNPKDKRFKQIAELYELDSDLFDDLKKFSIDKGFSIFNILKIAWAILISKYSNQDKIILAYPVGTRGEKYENIKGAFVNTSLYPFEAKGTCIDLLKKDKSSFIKENRYLNITDLSLHLKDQEFLLPVFIAQTTLGSRKLKLENCIDHFYNANIGHSELYLAYECNSDKLIYSITTVDGLFNKVFLNQVSGHFLNVLTNVLKQPDVSVNQISPLSKAEYNQIVHNWNMRETPYPKDKTIHQLFEEQVEKTPDNIAVIFEDKHMTYKELDGISNQLARQIRAQYKKRAKKELTSDTLVAICLDRSIEMIVSLLAVFKAGGAYVPIDPNYPKERINYILGDTGTKVLIAQSHLKKRLENIGLDKKHIQLIAIDCEETQREIKELPNIQLQPINRATDLAYVLYTSGSTGEPKGVMVEHTSVANLLKSLAEVYDYDKEHFRSAFFTSYVFDVSVSEIFTPLISGGELHVFSDETRKSVELVENYVVDNKINYLYLPPVLLSLFPRKDCPNLKTIIYAGEPCAKEVAKYWCKKMKVFNLYGPTEATIYAAWKQILHGEVEQIGKPVQNATAYVLDSHMQPVPIGVFGELYIGGDCLARGYQKRPDLTKKSFIPNPFASDKDKARKRNLRIYKTGDIARWLSDGNLEFVGRNDDQIKIRGFRVELGEIESKLSKYPGVGQCVVLCKERVSGKYLCAYYTSDKNISNDEILEYLSIQLPDYMVPSYFIKLDKLSLNTNGKVDKKSLPDPELKGDEDNYVAPKTELERQLVTAWQEVLGIDVIGINDDFFRLGGNSILGIKLVNSISNDTGLKVRLADIFKYSTIRLLISNCFESSPVVIPKTDITKAPLSFAQERLWFIEQYEGGSTAYNIPVFLELNDNANIDFLTKSLKAIFKRHEIFRTIFMKTSNGKSYQHILREIPPINEINIKNKQLSFEVQNDINYVFDLTKCHPVKVYIYRTENKNHLLVNLHHIAFDGWSADIFLKELILFYNCYANKTKLSLPELNIQYKDFSIWQRNYLTGEVLANQATYWKNKFDDYQTLNFPTDNIRPSEVKYAGENYSIEIKKNISLELRRLARESNTTIYNILLGAFYVLLYKYTAQKDLVIGTPVANRNYSQLENVIGFFVNSLPLRINLEPTDNFEELLGKVIELMKEAQEHQDIPFEKLVDFLDVPKDTSRHPIFQIMFSVQSFGIKKGENSLYKLVDIHKHYKIAKFDLSLFIDDSYAKLSCNYNYSTSLFNKDSIKRLSEHYCNILETIISRENIPINDIQFLSFSEYNRIIYDWNMTGAPYPKDKTIHQLFEEQVEKAPDNIAVVFEDQELTYRELNEKANQLAHTIRHEYKENWREKVKGDTLVGIYINRSLEMIIGILGILKSGAAYVPFDSADPEERLKSKISDCNCKMILTSSSSILSLLPLAKNDILPVAIDSYCSEIEIAPKNNPELINKSTDLAYVLYTSGSTGKPKGVMIEHKSVLSLVQSLQRTFNFTEDEKILFFASFAFSASVEQIFLALLSNLPLHVISKQLRRDPEKLKTYIKQNQLTHIHMTPSYLEQFGDLACPSVKRIAVGGEYCSLDLAKKHKGYKFINKYGPAETTNTTTQFFYDPQKSDYLTIGKQLDNITHYVLDRSLYPLPIGMAGELYIGGNCVARGYLNRLNLTKEKFINNPFASEEDKLKNRNLRVYKTGDIVRWLPDGNLEFIGRNDDQVKIRGFRIELGEIESKLSKHPDIDQCIVLCKERESDNYLCAYYTSDKEISNDEIRNYLFTLLPEYMIPSFFVYILKFPLNVSGKIDKKALPEPEFRGDKNNYLPPSNELEKQVRTVWEEVLVINDIGVNDNFFDIGGHSIKLLQLKSKFEQELGLEDIKVSDLFKYSTIRQFSEFLLGSNQSFAELYHINKLDSSLDDNIAVIGYSGAFSGSQSIDEYWQNIIEGKECIEILNKEECLKLGISKNLLDNPFFIPSGGRIKGTETFDPYFWGLSPKEASLIDPQIRKFLEHTWSVLEQTGYSTFRHKNNIGVFAGAGNSQYMVQYILPAHGAGADINLWEANTMGRNFISTRTSYLLGLRGPALNTTTACSTSLTAIVEACNHIAWNKCNMAIAGGVTLRLPEEHGYVYQDGMINSKDGHCRAFDVCSTGTVAGAGVGVVLLKKLKDAERDGDNILAVIKGYAINNDGNRKVGYTAPSVTGQSECILNAQKQAGITADTIDYVECHGTATNLGDPIEIAALSDVFKFNSSKKRKSDCVLGSVKANVGHADAAAGVAGFIKVCRMLETKTIPPQINFSKPNPELKLGATPFKIVTKRQEWQKKGHPRRAGVSSFGIGGTNAHVVLEEYIGKNSKDEPRNLVDHTYVIPISAKSLSSLQAYKQKLRQFIESNVEIHPADLASSLQRKEGFAYRSSISCSALQEASTKIKALGRPVKLDSRQLATQPTIVFMFSGFGAQYSGMAHSLYDECDEFRKHLDACIEFVSKRMKINFRNILLPKEENKSLISTYKRLDYGMPILFSVSYSLAKQFEKWGIKADICIGNSIGEYMAAAASGVFSVEDALDIVIKRGELMQQTPKGKMISIRAAYKKVNKLIGNKKLEISVINAPEYCVVSGLETDILEFKYQLEKSKMDYTELYIEHAAHSFLMDPVLKPFEEFISKFKLNKPKNPIISNTTGAILSPGQAVDPSYWSSHIRKTVQFSKGITTVLAKYPNAVFLELGPGNVLSTFVRQNVDAESSSNGKIVPRAIQTVMSVREFKSEQDVGVSTNLTYDALGKLWCYGYHLDWTLIHKNKVEDLRFVPNLPGYQFDKLKCWIDKPKIDFRNSKKFLNKIINILTKENVVISEGVVEKIQKEILHVDKKEQEIEKINKNKILIDDNTTELEMKLASIFYEVLGVEKISKNDSFFELGGTSLNALHLVTKINNYFDLKLTPSFLVNNSTVHRMGLELGHNKKFDIIVTLRDGNGVPILLIHPVGGDLLCYKEFCDKYTGNNKIYGVRDPRYNSFYDNSISSIKDMAELYIQEVRKRHGFGPYIIGGASFGGVVAYEMANQLINNGEEILTFMIDTPGPKRFPDALRSPLEVLDYFMSYEDKKENIEIRKKLKSFADDKARLFDYAISNKIAGFENESLLKKMIGIFLDNSKLMRKYRNPAKFKGKSLLYFKALEVHHHLPDKIEKGWDGYIDPGQLKLYEISGNHKTMNESPNIEKICNINKGVFPTGSISR